MPVSAVNPPRHAPLHPVAPSQAAAEGRGRPPVWLPWLLAPAFFLLPIGGCGAVASLRRPDQAASAVPLPGPAASMASVVTMMPAGR